MVKIIVNKKGQTVLELGVMGAFILFAMGVLFSFSQQLGSQQFVQMEAFREALKYSCKLPPQLPTDLGVLDIVNQGGGFGAGAACDYTVIRHPRQADMSSEFKKGEATSISASSSVYWAVPRIAEGSRPLNMVLTRVNDNVHWHVLNTLLGMTFDIGGETIDIGKYISFSIDKIESEHITDFKERSRKKETAKTITPTGQEPGSIATTRRSEVTDTIKTKLYGSFRPQLVFDADDDEDLSEQEQHNQGVMSTVYNILLGLSGISFSPDIPIRTFTQNLYRQKDVLHDKYYYSYSTSAPKQPVVRERKWETKFKE